MAGLSDASAWDSGPSIYSVPGLQPHWGSLKSAGLTFLSQIPLSLDKLMQICSVKSANSILQIVQDYNQDGPTFTSAFVLCKQMPKRQLLSSFCNNLDSAIGGGLGLGSVTELAGQPGVGKTQTCIQWSVTVQWPTEHGGFRGRAIYLDCDANFFPERVHQIASSLVLSNPHLCRITKNAFDARSNLDQVQLFLDGILHKRIDSLEDLNSTINLLKTGYLDSAPDVRLLVIDSLAFHFRYPLLASTGTSLTNFLHALMQNLNYLAHNFNLAVVVTNQVTTVPKEDQMMNIGSDSLIPALGESFSHAASARIWLDFSHQSNSDEIENVQPVKTRTVKLVKSPRFFVSQQAKKFNITSGGLVD